jgi:urease accessory protein UreH
MFHRLAHQLRLVVGGGLRYLERYSIEPAVQRPDAAWMAADSSYLGTVLELGRAIDRARTDAAHALLQDRPGLRAAADLVASRLMLIRTMASSGVAFHAARELLARESTLNRNGEIDSPAR